jgi:hypothetical protein
MAASGNGKDVIYVDVDDEITGIIDKVSSSSSKVVALVLPKRASVFQSIVNMKLLKKRGEAAGKHVVLITSEQGLLPLAGTVGLYVARTLTSKPEIPAGTTVAIDADEDDINDDGETAKEDFDSEKAGATAVGALAGAGAASVNDDDDGDMELDNSEEPAEKSDDSDQPAQEPSKKKSEKAKKDRNLKVPNFKRFRMIVILGIVFLVALIVAMVYAMKVLPKAHITIHTDTSTVNSSLNLSLDTTATTVSADNNTVPAQVKTQQKNSTEQAAATGKKNEGHKASGTAKLSLTDCSQATVTVPAGTGLSSNGLTYFTSSSVTLDSVMIGGSCKNKDFDNLSSASVSINAQNGGAQYNQSNADFTVAGFSNVSASGSASGGTDNIVTVVQQSDIDGAKSKLKTDMNADQVKQQLAQQLQASGLYPVQATFSATDPKISADAQSGDKADTVTVTESTTYTMFGVQKSDVQQLLDANIKQQIDAKKQSILDEGLSQQSFNVQNPSAKSPLSVALTTTATVGPHIDTDSLKTQVSGKKSGDVKTMIKALPGVTDVQVHYSPFFVTAAPSDPAKITINVDK